MYELTVVCLLGFMWARAYGAHGVQRCLYFHSVCDVHFIAFTYQGVFSVPGVHGVYVVILPLFTPFVLLVVHSIVYLYY